MGEYLKNGQKIGTCGVAYYATKTMLEAVKNQPEAASYLDPKNNCTFAFPFPQYDGKNVGEISNFHEGERVDQVIMLRRSGVESFHKKIVHHIHPSGGQGINLFCDCPYHNSDNVSKNFNDDFLRFYLRNQLYYNGELHISGECIYCGEKNIFSAEEAQEIANHLEGEAVWNETESKRPEYKGMSNADNHLKSAVYLRLIAERILNTYKR
jgi:hypothetical protein